jgi:hypothetical protein
MDIHELSQNLCLLKKEFAQYYDGTSHIQEFIIDQPSEKFPINDKDLKLLHLFAQKNPIYYNSYEEQISGIKCTVYEGDINQYWLNSIKHGSSCQPFYPTWIMSAYIMAKIAKELDFQELIDIGSGDGRIAYCGKVLGMNSYGIEIDDILVELQNNITNLTGINFDPKCTDALEFDYSKLNLGHPVFFIGGLPQMGGDVLATSIIEKINSNEQIKMNTGIVFAGSHSKRKLSGNQEIGGWSSLIKKHHLREILTVSLPTVWTFDQNIDTPYIYTSN